MYTKHGQLINYLVLLVVILIIGVLVLSCSPAGSAEEPVEKTQKKTPICCLICCEEGTISTGGTICGGAAKSVPAEAKIKITNSSGNSVETEASKDGSFFKGIHQLDVKAGDTVTVTVVNDGSCIEKVVLWCKDQTDPCSD